MPVALADPESNARTVVDLARECHEDGVAVAIFPELCLSGYSIDDLFLQDTLLAAVEQALFDLVEASRELLPVIVVGLPLRSMNRVYNCAAVIKGGELMGIVPKGHLPTYRE